MSVIKHKKELFLFMVIYGLMPFLSFHAFLFSIYYYRNGLEIPLFIFFPILWVCYLRIISYMPEEMRFFMGKPSKSVKRFFPVRSVLSWVAVLEAAIWYIIVLATYFHLHLRFGFPASLQNNGNPIFPIVGGYIAFFLGAIVGTILLMSVVSPIREILSSVLPVKLWKLMQRLLAVFLGYIMIICLYSGIYRLISYQNSKMFLPPIDSTVDSLYFSAVTITTVGFGDTTPNTPLSKIIVISESLIGVLFLAAMIGIVIGVTLKEKLTSNKSFETKEQ